MQCAAVPNGRAVVDPGLRRGDDPRWVRKEPTPVAAGPRRLRIARIAAVALLCAGASAPVGAAAEEREQDYPPGAGREFTFAFCSACHGFKIVAAQGMTRELWDEALR